MCHFVTAVLSDKAPHAELDAIARKYGREIQPLANPSIQRQIRRDQQYFRTTVGHCDCGTVLGSDHERARLAPNWAAEEQRLLKKGWSKTKVDRSLAQKRDSSASPDQASIAELASWRSLIAEILDSGAREFGLLLHSYRGSLDEDIQLKGTEQIAAGDATSEMLRQMREDVLYVFRAGA